jgi:hypothetical protein
MRRSVFEAMGGLLEFSILGSGDIHFAFALINRIDETLPVSLHADYRRTAQAWGAQLAKLADNGSSVGYVPINIWHHWHGNRVDRGYFQRWSLSNNIQPNKKFSVVCVYIRLGPFLNVINSLHCVIWKRTDEQV